MGWYLLIGFFVLVFMGVPVFASIGLISVGYLAIQHELFNITVFASKVFSGINSFELIAIPLFIFAGDLLYEGKISQALVDFAKSIVGSVRGSTAIVASLACAFFGAVSGSAPATTSAIGAVVAKPMGKEGYPKDFIGATLAASGPLGALIPPSLLMVIYGCTTNTSIGALLLGGIGPGVVYMLLIMIYEYTVCRKNGWGTTTPFSLRNLWVSFRKSILALLFPIIILGGIYSGMFTATEAAAIAVLYAFIIGVFVYKSISWKTLPKILLNSAIGAAIILIISGTIAMFTWVLVRERIPETLTKLAIANVKTPFMFLMIANGILILAGMIEAGSSCILLLAPLLHPIALSFGIDPVFFGALFVANMAIGMVTPPVALTLYVAQRICGVDITQIIRRVIPFFLVMLVGLLLCTIFPEIILFLPRILG